MQWDIVLFNLCIRIQFYLDPVVQSYYFVLRRCDHLINWLK